MKQVVLLGGYPPPVGGNSVHIERLARGLVAHGYRCHVVDPYSAEPVVATNNINVSRVGGKGLRSLIKAALLIRKIKPDVVHMHVSAMERFVYAGPVLLLLSGRISRRVLTIHSGSFAQRFIKQLWLKRLFSIAFLKKFDTLITVNAEQKSVLVRYGCDEQRVRTIPAYIAPDVSESAELAEVIAQARADNKDLLVTSGYGLPLYGYEKIVHALISDSQLARRFRLVICMYNTYDESYINQLQQSIGPLEGTLIFRGLSAGEFAYLLARAAVYVRATDRDGDAVAIREANSFGVQVIASSVVSRPAFCKLFDRESTASLVQSLGQGLNKHGDGDADIVDGVSKIMACY